MYREILMMSEQDVVKNILTKLRESVQKKDLSKCLEHVGIIREYFDGTLNTSQISKFFFLFHFPLAVRNIFFLRLHN